jgi:hypothetical protein
MMVIQPAFPTWLQGRDAFPVLVYIYYGLWIGLMVAHSILKKWVARSAGNAVTSAMLKEGDLKISGYKVTKFGTVCLWVYHSFTPVFVVVYLLLIFDTYWKCQLKGPDALCFKGSNPLLGSGKFPVRGCPSTSRRRVRSLSSSAPPFS